MLQTQKTLVTYSIRRYLMTSGHNYRNNYMARQGKFMRKLMREDAPKKKWHVGRQNKPGQAFGLDTARLVSPHITRRVEVLNKLFMTHITDLMATGEASSDLVGRGIEVSRVKLANDFHVVRVYWFSSDTNVSRIADTAKLLESAAFRLRHELSQLRVIGVVPPILFVQEKGMSISAELEKRMLEADYGEDHVPLVKTPRDKPELTLFTKLSDDLREKISGTEEERDCADTGESEEAEDDGLYAFELPPMKHNVLGLNHSVIMLKVKQSLNKARTSGIQDENRTSFDFQQPFNPETITMLQTEETMKSFDDFLLKRKIEDRRREKWELRNLDSGVIDDVNERDDDEFYEEEESLFYGNAFDEFEDIDLRDHDTFVQEK